MAKANGKKTKTEKTPQGITHITVGGYKSIAREQTIEIRPLTILAGANSSGKSSMMQPLLLLKQTLEAPYDPGALLLNGPNVRFTSVDQLLTRLGKNDPLANFTVGLRIEDGGDLSLEFARDSRKRLAVQRQRLSNAHETTELAPSFTEAEIISNSTRKENYRELAQHLQLSVVAERCFLEVSGEAGVNASDGLKLMAPARWFAPPIQLIIHVPGLRGNPERAYPVTTVGRFFPGKFESYAASVVSFWSTDGKGDELNQLNCDLRNVGLTWRVEAKPINESQVELRVGRLRQSSRRGADDLVNIADVGFGVSQTLPVVVALLAAEPGQLVYLEQPEIHLHPRAQVAMAQILANAAMRGVKVVAETHSSLLLLGVQSLVAEGKLPRDKVILHWFERNDEGATDIRTAELDDSGRFGDWPEDFDDVTLEAQQRYLDAAEGRRAAR